jgi:hypothetical protein
MTKPEKPQRENIKWPEFAFELFWEAYPLKVKKARARLGLKKVQREGKIEFETILTAVKKFATMIRRTGELCPHPATWINDERWDDELEQQKDSDAVWRARKSYEETIARRRMQ